MREPKFNFVRLDKTGIEEEGVVTITVNKKGAMFLTKEFIETHQCDGKLMEFFGDSSKKVLAWRFKDKVDNFKDLKPKKGDPIRLVRQNPKSKQAVVGIKILLERTGISLEDYKGLVIKEYKKDLLFGPLFYIEFPDHTNLEHKSNSEDNTPIV